MKKRLFSVICMCLLMITLLPIPSVCGNEAMCFYVDPAAEAGGEGTETSPFSSIQEAQTAVREVNANQTSDIYVYLREGTHYLSAPLELTQADSGNNGFSVRYMSYPGEEAAISGAQVLTGWTEGADGLWQTTVELPEGIDYITSMDVNGVPARRAQSEEPGRMKSPYPSVSDLQGFYTAAAVLPHTYQNQQDIQLQVAYMWRTYIFNIEAILPNAENPEESIVTISRFFDSEQIKEDIPQQISYITNGVIDWGFRIINAKEELDRPGEYYYDRTTKVLYYMPREGEDMTSAKVEVPVLEKLIAAKGSAAECVQNISFSGITFAHTAWQDMSRYGFHTGQSNEFYAAAEMNGYDDFVGKFIVPAAVRLDFTENITFENNVFRALDTVGIGLYHGADYTNIEGNQFYDLADSAVTVGLPNQAYESTQITGRNLAEGKPAIDNAGNRGVSRYHTYMGPESAVDPNKVTKWVSNITYDGEGKAEFPWWQVDLGEPYEIDRIEITARQDAEGVPNRRYFEVMASNDPEFKDYTLLYRKGNNGTGGPYAEEEDYPAYGDWGVDIEDAGTYRYVRLQKIQYKEEFAFSEVRVINKSMDYSPAFKLSRHNEIQNNVITRTSQKNIGAPGIQTYFTEDVLIAHNDISHLPYSGICIGWGWLNYLDMTHSREVKVKNNKIYDVMQQMVDGGGIYNLGPQPDSEITGNHVAHMDNAISGVYLDSGSDYFTVKNNVFEDVILSTTGGGGQISDNSGTVIRDRTNYIEDNYSSSPFGSSANMQSVSSAGTLKEPTVFIEGQYPDGAREIVRDAGITGQWQHLLYDVPEAAFPLPEWARYENVIHVSRGGSMHDRRFIEWHLRYFIAKCEELLAMAKEQQGDGYMQYPATAVTEFETTLASVKTYFEPEYAKALALGNTDLTKKFALTSRQEVLNQRDALRAALAKLSASINTADESVVTTVAPVTLTKVNVAKYKPVINVVGLVGGSATGLNNDNAKDCLIGPSVSGIKGYIGIDLQRRYPISQVVLYDYTDSSYTYEARTQFEILGSDTKNIADAKVIFTLNEPDNTEFIANGRYVADIPEAPAYRYIFYRSLIPDAKYGLREMEVFSTVQATEVSRDAKTYTTNNLGSAGYTGDRAVDGNYVDGTGSLYLKTVPANDEAYATLGGYYNTLTVDLGTSRHLDMIEIYGRAGVNYNTNNYHGFFALYGSHKDGTITDFETLYDEDTIYGKIDRTTFEGLTGSDGITKAYTRLAQQAGYVRDYTTADGYVYDIFPNTTLNEPKSYRTMVDRNLSFRYLTHRKTATNAHHMTYIGEFIAYQFNPEAYGLADLSQQGASIRFSDFNMDAASLENNITISDANGVIEGAISSVTLKKDSADAIVTFNKAKLVPGTDYTLTVGAGVRNTYGMSLTEAESFTFTYKTDYMVTNRVEPEEISQTGSNTFSFSFENNTKAEKNVFAAIALYSGETLLEIQLQKQAVAAAGDADFSVTAVNATDKTVTAYKTFIWDADTMAPIV